jgi:hypothetical protein
MSQSQHIQKIVPCECGSLEPYWHGPEEGRREYCCDACWDRRRQACVKRKSIRKTMRDMSPKKRMALAEAASASSIRAGHIYSRTLLRGLASAGYLQAVYGDTFEISPKGLTWLVSHGHPTPRHATGRTSRDQLKPCPIGTKIQSVVLDRHYFTLREATSWIRRHGFVARKVDDTGHSYRFRQHEPDDFREGSFRTLSLRPGVQSILGCPAFGGVNPSLGSPSSPRSTRSRDLRKALRPAGAIR